MANEKKISPKTMSRKIGYIIIAAVLVVGFGFGTIFGTAVNMRGWFGNGAVDEGFEQARPQLEQQLIQEKENELLSEHLDALREESDIEIFLEAFDPQEPDAVIAVVNQEEIRTEDLMEVEEIEKQQMAMMGMDPEDPQTAQMIEEMRPEILDSVIINTILMQKVKEAGIQVSDQEIEDQYQMFAQQFGGEEMLEQTLAQEGITRQDLEQQIYEQLALQAYAEKYLEENLDPQALDFTEEELRALYDMQQQMQEQQMQGF